MDFHRRSEVPALRPLADGRHVACHLVEQGANGRVVLRTLQG
jgi:hypothetical protein